MIHVRERPSAKSPKAQGAGATSPICSVVAAVFFPIFGTESAARKIFSPADYDREMPESASILVYLCIEGVNASPTAPGAIFVGLL
jgi:hypothetical protein